MIYIVYTTQTTHKQYKFDLSFGWMDFQSQIRKSSIGRDTIGYSRDPVPMDKFINAGLDIKFEGESSFEEALIKILPYNKPVYEISDVWGYLNGLKGTIRKVVETNLLSEKYKDIYELYNDIREMYKKTAISMVSLYAPMYGIYKPYSSLYNQETVPEKLLYENIEQIEASIQNAFSLQVVQCNIGAAACKDIVATEYHADLVKTCPFVRLDIYFNRKFTQQELDQFKEKHFGYLHFREVQTSLPEYRYDVSIQACDPVFTAEEMNQKYFNK